MINFDEEIVSFHIVRKAYGLVQCARSPMYFICFCHARMDIMIRTRYFCFQIFIDFHIKIKKKTNI